MKFIKTNVKTRIENEFLEIIDKDVSIRDLFDILQCDGVQCDIWRFGYSDYFVFTKDLDIPTEIVITDKMYKDSIVDVINVYNDLLIFKFDYEYKLDTLTELDIETLSSWPVCMFGFDMDRLDIKYYLSGQFIKEYNSYSRVKTDDGSYLYFKSKNK